MLFTLTNIATCNLANEGITGESVHQVGDVMYYAAQYYCNKAQRLAGIQQDSGFILSSITLRAENTDSSERLANIIRALNNVSAETPVIFPLHPRTRKLLGKGSYDTLNTTLLEPVSYLKMIWLMKQCKLVVSDSGGLQKKTYLFEKLCVTTRDQTEWVELIECGANLLVGADKILLLNAITENLSWPYFVKKLLILHKSSGIETSQKFRIF